MNIIFRIVRAIFPKKKLIYTAFGTDNYFKIAGKLRSNGIKYYTKSPIDANSSNRDYFVQKFRQYDIYVKAEDEGLAVKAIHKKEY